jgi:predicted TIM-barrel fold metal-dependent hydrolase
MSFIDVQCHPGIPLVSDLYPYMEDSSVDRMRRSLFQLPSAGRHPGIDERSEDLLSIEGLSSLLDPDVTAAVLVPHQAMPVAGWCDTKLNGVFASAVNKYAEEKWLPSDSRFYLAGAISPQEPEEAVKEIRRLASHPRVVAVCMPLININLGQSHYQPILQALAESRLPLIIHMSGGEGLIVGAPTLGGIGPRRPEERYGILPQVAAANIASLIYDGVFVKFPNLRVIFADFGFDWAVSLMWRLDSEWRNLSLDVPWLKEPPSKFFERNIRLMIHDVGLAPTKLTRHVSGLLPSSMLMYGSNAPFSYTNRSTLIESIPEVLRENFLEMNALNTFAIKVAYSDKGTKNLTPAAQ